MDQLIMLAILVSLLAVIAFADRKTIRCEWCGHPMASHVTRGGLTYCVQCDACLHPESVS